MAKQNLKAALGASLRAEHDAVVERFAKADAYFHEREQGGSRSPEGPAREKVIRDGFTMPISDYALIAQVQATSLQAGRSVTKSEVLRAGLHALSTLSLIELQAFCPFHGSRRQRSLRVQVHSGRFVCVLCGAWGTVEAGCQRWRAELQRQPTDRRSRVRQRRVPRHPQPTTGGGRRRSPHGTPGHNSRYISSESSRLTT